VNTNLEKVNKSLWLCRTSHSSLENHVRVPVTKNPQTSYYKIFNSVPRTLWTLDPVPSKISNHKPYIMNHTLKTDGYARTCTVHHKSGPNIMSKP
jgi:hypothetical protein